MKFEYLSNRPEAVPQIARWYFDQWGHLLESETYERSIERLHEYVRDDQMPLMVLAIEDGEVVGAAQLKFHEMEEVYPDLENWLGGLYVAEVHRSKGIGTKLVDKIMELAPGFGVTKLYLQTEALDGGLYAKLGWKPIENYQGEHLLVLVMENDIAA